MLRVAAAPAVLAAPVIIPVRVADGAQVAKRRLQFRCSLRTLGLARMAEDPQVSRPQSPFWSRIFIRLRLRFCSVRKAATYRLNSSAVPSAWWQARADSSRLAIRR